MIKKDKQEEKPTSGRPTKNKYENGKMFVLDENEFLRVSPQLAKAIGLNECLMLLQLEFLIAVSGKYRDGRLWVYESNKEWQKYLTFMSTSTINRTARSLIEKKLVLATGEYNKLKYDRSRWYSINIDECAKLPGININPKLINVTQSGLGQTTNSCSQQSDPNVNQNDTESDQNEPGLNQDEPGLNQSDTTIPETSTKKSTDTSTKTNSAPQENSMNLNPVVSKKGGKEFDDFYEIALQTCKATDGEPWLKNLVKKRFEK